MDQPVGCRRRWEHARRVGRWGLTGLLVRGGRTLAVHAGVGAAAPPSQGGTMVWAVPEGMPTFDLHDETPSIAAQPVGPLDNGLLTFDGSDHEKIVGDLTERWESRPDGKHLTCALRTGVTFHEGAEFTWAAATYSFDTLADPTRAHRTFVAMMATVFAGTTCTDDVTLVLPLQEPAAALFTMLAGAHAVMMKTGLAEQVDRQDPNFLVGTGPFPYTAYIPGVHFRAARHPHYGKPGLPYINAYAAVVMPDLTRIFASFRARQLTMTGIGRHRERPEADIRPKDVPDAVVALGPRGGWDAFVRHVTRLLCHDGRVRKAVALATDREQMSEIGAEGWGVLGGSMGPHTPYGLPPEALTQYPPFGDEMAQRQAKAKRLLADAGHARGLDIEVIVRRGPLDERPARSRHDALNTVGVTIKITLLDTAGLRDRQEKGDVQAFETLAAVQLDDPDFSSARFTCGAPSNDGKYGNPAFDQLCAEQSRTFDVQQRAEITRQMERILLHDIPDARGFFWKSAMGYLEPGAAMAPSAGDHSLYRWHV